MNTTITAQNTEAVATQTEVPLRPAMIGVLARAEAAEQAALAENKRLQAEIERLRTEQITDGSDPRLERFWDKAGRIADAADFCSEYDRMADAMNGPQRARDYDVTLTIRAYATHTVTVSAVSEEDACEIARDNFEISDLDADSTDEWEVTNWDADRA